MERKILDLLARFDGGSARLDHRPVRQHLLTSREVALLLGAGAGEAVRVVADADVVRSSIADMALAWRRVLTPAAPLPPPMCVLDGVARALALIAEDDAMRDALRWLAAVDPFWELLARPRTPARRTT